MFENVTTECISSVNPFFFSAQEYLQSSHNKPRVHDSLSSLVRRPNIIEKKKTPPFTLLRWNAL